MITLLLLAMPLFVIVLFGKLLDMHNEAVKIKRIKDKEGSTDEHSR